MAKYVCLSLLALASICARPTFAQVALAQDGDANRGENLFRKRCAGCHINKGPGGRGPNLTDIVGGKPSTEEFKYSSSIRVHGWIWSVERLDDYLKSPASVVQGATSAARVRNKKDRTDLIAYLKTLRSPEDAPKLRGKPITQ